MKKRHKNYGLTYSSWAMMKNRCLNPKAQDYRYYGGRGITVCKRWLDFKNFKSDMGERTSKRFSLGRINNQKGYSPTNCRWETGRQQSQNRRGVITQAMCLAIRADYMRGESQKSIAKKRKISIGSVACISRAIKWD